MTSLKLLIRHISTRGQQRQFIYTKQEFNYLLLFQATIVNIFAIVRKKVNKKIQCTINLNKLSKIFFKSGVETK